MQGQHHAGSTVRSTPNRRDLRKYARLFVKTDLDADGFVSSDEAYSLFTKSHVPEDILQQVWMLSNVSGSGMLSFPEFIAAMHLIREARQTQQNPAAISPELSAFLGSFSESPHDLSVEGSSQSARALQRSHANPSPAPLQAASATVSTQGTSSPHFGHAAPEPLPEKDAFGAGASEPFPEGDGKKKKGRRKERREKEKERSEEKEEVAEKMAATQLAASPAEAAWDQEPSAAPALPGDFGSPWTTFGDSQQNLENERENGTAGKAREKKDRKDKEKADRKEEKHTRFLPEASSWPGGEVWSDPVHRAADPMPQSPNRFRTGGSQASQPPSRMGLRFDLDFGKDADPDYMARLQEILNLRATESPPATSPKRMAAASWAGRRNDGHFEERHTGAYQHMGDYASPALRVALMGFRSTAQGPAVLPEPGRPFLKSLTPHFGSRSAKEALEVSSDAMYKSMGRLTFAPMTAA